MTIAMTMKINLDPSICACLPYLLCAARSQSGAGRPGRLRWWQDHALRAAAYCFLPAPDELDTA
jgi:hypothetical protein